jgi:hypothetical protein
MKHLPKYILLAVQLYVLAWVMMLHFSDDQNILIISGIVISIVITFLMRNIISKWTFNKILFIGTFLVILYVPLVGPRETTSFEKRELAPFPEFRAGNPWKFFFGYQSWFNDRFAFRNDAVQLISKLRFRLFKVSPMPKIVETGQGDWLFTSRPEYILDTSTPFTPEQLDTVILNLQMITKYFEERNISFYFAMIPVKERIYPEYLPASLEYRMRFSKAAQLNERLKQHPEIRSVDVKDVLIEGKKVRPTYYTVDTHWNEYGAFLGYRKIIERVRQDYPQIVPFEITDYEIDSVMTDAGDLQLLMGFRDEIEFLRYHLKPINLPTPIVIDSSNYVPGSTRYSIREVENAPTDLKLFLVRDSFSEYMRRYITPHFKRTVLAWVPVIPVGQAVKEQPDIVVQEILEHFVRFTLQLPPEIQNDTLFLNKNFPGYLKNNISPSSVAGSR